MARTRNHSFTNKSSSRSLRLHITFKYKLSYFNIISSIELICTVLKTIESVTQILHSQKQKSHPKRTNRTEQRHIHDMRISKNQYLHTQQCEHTLPMVNKPQSPTHIRKCICTTNKVHKKHHATAYTLNDHHHRLISSTKGYIPAMDLKKHKYILHLKYIKIHYTYIYI